MGSLGAAAGVGCVVLLVQGGAIAQAVPEICVGIGDVVQVTVFESMESTAGSGRPDNFVTLPSQTVDAKGTFPVPFAGDIGAAGRSLLQIKREIEANLAKRTRAQVEVALIKQNSTGRCQP
jgi:polysaccharide export outer membrane protein